MDNATQVVVLTTVSSEADAEQLATALVKDQLAACVAIAPIRSIYRWQNKLCKDTEWQLAIKTRQDAFTPLAKRIQELHSYELPEIIALPIVEGAPEYLNWIDQQLHPSIS